VWLDGVLRNELRAEEIGEIVGLPASKRVRILLPVGVPTEEPSRKEKLAFDRPVWFNI